MRYEYPEQAIKDMTAEAKDELLIKILKWLNELDTQDAFGTEGWERDCFGG